MKLASLLILSFLFLNTLTHAQFNLLSVTGKWSFCGVLQGPAWYSITSALFYSNTTSTSHNGYGVAFLGTPKQGTGYRLYYDLTQGASPVLTQNLTIVQLDPPGSTGGNSNYFYPANSPELGGDGVTWRFTQIPHINGQAANASLGDTVSMNFWFTNGEYDEENKGGTHETNAWASTLAIVPVTLTSNILPTCAPTVNITFFYCFTLASSTYSVVMSGYMTTNGIAQLVTASSSNELTQNQQAVFPFSANGTRVYTDNASGNVTTLQVISLLPPNSALENLNYLYPAGPLVTDWNGIAFQMSGNVPIAGEVSASSQLVFWYEQSTNSYLEETALDHHESTPSYSNFFVQSMSPYTPSPPPACVLPQIITSSIIYYSFCSQLVTANFSSILSGILTLQNLPYSNAGAVYYIVTGATGIRTYTNMMTNVQTINYITGIAGAGAIGGPDNYLYPNGTNPSVPNSPVVDGDGITFTFNSMPPIFGEPTGTTTDNEMNWWWDGTAYLEETTGGAHEVVGTILLSQAAVAVASVDAPVPLCTLPSSLMSLGTGLSQWQMCARLVGKTYISMTSAIITGNTTAISSSPLTYYAVAAQGTRSYTNLTTTPYTQQYAYITALSPPGSTGGNDNVFYPSSHPALDGDGLTFQFNTIPLIAGQIGLSNAGTQENLWYASGNNAYLEENAGGQHESLPVYSIATFTPYTYTTGFGSQCNLPSSVPLNFCYYAVGSTYTVLFFGIIYVNPISQLIQANSNNQLPSSQQAFTAVNATGTRIFTTLSTGQHTSSSIVSLAPGFIGATQYVYYGFIQGTDWNGIAFNMNNTVQVSGEPDNGGTFVLWYEAAYGQYLEETQNGHYETTPTSSSLTFSVYTGQTAPCIIPAANIIQYSFCSLIGSSFFTSVMSGILTLQTTPVISNGLYAYVVLNGTGTRTYTDLMTGQVQVAHILYVAPLSTNPVGGPDNLLFYQINPVLDGNGITFEFDVEPIINGQPLGTNAQHQMNWWFTNGFYDEETAGGTHESQATYSSVTIAPYISGNLPACSYPASSSSSSVVSSSSTAVTASLPSSAGSIPSIPSSTASSTDAVGKSSTSFSGLSNGSIAGIVIGSVAGATIFLALCVYLIFFSCTGSKISGKGEPAFSDLVPEHSTNEREIEMA